MFSWLCHSVRGSLSPSLGSFVTLFFLTLSTTGPRCITMVRSLRSKTSNGPIACDPIFFCPLPSSGSMNTAFPAEMSVFSTFSSLSKSLLYPPCFVESFLRAYPIFSSMRLTKSARFSFLLSVPRWVSPLKKNSPGGLFRTSSKGRRPVLL